MFVLVNSILISARLQHRQYHKNPLESFIDYLEDHGIPMIGMLWRPYASLLYSVGISGPWSMPIFVFLCYLLHSSAVYIYFHQHCNVWNISDHVFIESFTCKYFISECNLGIFIEMICNADFANVCCLIARFLCFITLMLVSWTFVLEEKPHYAPKRGWKLSFWFCSSYCHCTE